ncbi:DNA repair protein RecO [Lysobacter sp. TY2-98]|uniref:DNA repair protein RecO n=1 Tax=Lysobacter sp. TY2-98 TaxID=2290922 RepID=UPI000E2094F4|nr:DNA repair protein RecO [Lysobacter sp. TY2-98]AXK72300.1 DNA repair protein RecO [Lysobacter sp. TY2-98]
MRYVQENAFVLHARPYRETSLLVELLTAQYGRIGLLARGVTGPRRQLLRAALQPLQWIRFDAVQRGELAQLANGEAVDAAPRLVGDAALGAFYLNELTLRLAPRHDPQPGLFTAYARARERLRAGESLAWTLRRYERDLLQALGLGFDWAIDGNGQPIDPAARYRLDPEHGPRRLLSDRGAADRSDAPSGQALLALVEDEMPAPADLAALRRAMRRVLEHHVGPRGLTSWQLLGELSRVGAGGQSAGN